MGSKPASDPPVPVTRWMVPEKLQLKLTSGLHSQVRTQKHTAVHTQIQKDRWRHTNIIYTVLCNEFLCIHIVTSILWISFIFSEGPQLIQVPFAHLFTYWFVWGGGAPTHLSSAGITRAHYHVQFLFVCLFNTVSGDRTQAFMLARQVSVSPADFDSPAWHHPSYSKFAVT